MVFELFDPDEPVDITTRRLPHWFQPGAVCFVTFRTADSMPREVLSDWLRARDEWLRRHGIDAANRDWEARLQSLPIAERREFSRNYSEQFHAVLDQGHGECVLRRPDLAEIVATSLRHFDGDRYDLGDFVIMPNHVHLLVAMHGDTTIDEQCKSWKKFSAAKINAALNRRGHFWQAEAFDHLIRSPEQFKYLRRYIAENPIKARLKEGDYFHRKA
ncbi:MAG: hypothetical protein C0483_15415 [Pirellula sp.]|nr:hypothetical protein [Pirellula sp.]